MSESRCRLDVALRTQQGLYVTALPKEGNWRLAGIANRILSWENFVMIQLGQNQVALKTAHSTYVSAKNEKDEWRLRADADRILGWEIFILEERGASFTLRTAHQGFVCSGPVGPPQHPNVFFGSLQLEPNCYFSLVYL